MSIQARDGPAHVVTGVQLDARGQVVRVRWYLADRRELACPADHVPSPLSQEAVVDTVEVVDKLLDAEPVVPLFQGPDGARLGDAVKVHVESDGSESIEVDPRRPGRSLRDLPRL
ncbi:hypothetical protein [Pseudorhodoferax sp.]|uniref:hypothetical protein n=1 Tax=Pseudorhodoferax sp. TaxID=1993553 RepID=UPI0039E6424A